MIKLIDHWVLHRTNPAFDDKDSLTVIELVGRNTKKINEIVELVNKNIDEINKTIEEFTKDTQEEMDVFRVAINQKIKDFIEIVNMKLADFDGRIEDTIIYIKENLATYIKTELERVLKEMIAEGLLDDEILSLFEEVNNIISSLDTRLTKLENQELKLTYDETTETLNIVITYPEEV